MEHNGDRTPSSGKARPHAVMTEDMGGGFGGGHRGDEGMVTGDGRKVT